MGLQWGSSQSSSRQKQKVLLAHGQGAHAKAVNYVNPVVKTFNAGGDKAPYAVEEKTSTSSEKSVPCNAASVTTC